ncbi:DUF3298 and DUF4163 domain-containing protein [Paenibacillus spiritus]|uniref:DUF3298 and DUF4163 domain-containing protein n=1 Tax=Paenibacillus spiritus TaxID=2496557 RepID=A0A5J5G5C9_9BACL|nr:DUF3298 and DUF4163 domain-containing protein [Paenibacillus spiritus]KAA9002367.1 DUF3298 and DUF4163 domain-containing protein [Paenibacillus spiritus]
MNKNKDTRTGSKWRTQAARWGIGAAAAALLAAGLPAETGLAAPAAAVQKAAQSTVLLKWNGAVTKQQGLYKEGAVWVPVSFLRDTLKLNVTYNKEQQTYQVGSGVRKLTLYVSEYGISPSVNGFFLSEYEGLLQSGKLYVPVGLLTDYMGYQADFSKASGRLNLMPKAQNALAVSSSTYAADKEGAAIHLEYPQISGLNNAAVQQKINETLKQANAAFTAEMNNELAKRGEDERPYEFDSRFLVTYNSNGLLSLVMDQYSYLGGAHGMTYRQGFTFSLKDGKRLLLKDLFGANPNYKKVLNAKAGKELRAMGGYLGGFTGLTTEKYFYLKEGKAVLFFQLYDYTAYAQGFPLVTFDFKELLPPGQSVLGALK